MISTQRLLVRTEKTRLIKTYVHKNIIKKPKIWNIYYPLGGKKTPKKFHDRELQKPSEF